MQGSRVFCAPSIAPSQTLLVVDDEALRENLQELFESQGYRVLTAPNGAEALRRLETAAVDLVLTDCKMPGFTGVDLVDAVRRRSPRTWAVLVTAFGDSFAKGGTVRRGAVGCLNKPLEANEIVDVVRKILHLGGT